MIIVGFVWAVQELNKFSVIGMWVLGVLFLIPGGYNTIQVFRAYRSENDNERTRLLNSI